MVYLRCLKYTLCGITVRFQTLSPSEGQVAHALLTRPPLSHIRCPSEEFFLQASFDLHVLSTPPAFVLSQDQTLKTYYLNTSFGVQTILIIRSALRCRLHYCLALSLEPEFSYSINFNRVPFHRCSIFKVLVRSSFDLRLVHNSKLKCFCQQLFSKNFANVFSFCKLNRIINVLVKILFKNYTNCLILGIILFYIYLLHYII